ncbi:MAG: hypothetical protein Q7S12_02260 [bacterium]|nr:hypothetical protein [bacterium]
MAKQTIIHHNIEPVHYVSDAFISWCFDARFSELLNKFIELRKFKNVDIVKMAGGGKVFATPEIETEEIHYLGQIAKSVKLHHTKSIILMAHANCGAYGKHFEDKAMEEAFYVNELRAAKETVASFLKKNEIKIPIETYYADFSGLHLIN